MKTSPLPLKSRSSRFASPKALALSLSAVLSLALLVALALTSLVAPAAGAGAANEAPAQVAISQVVVKDKKVTVFGRVTLPINTAAERQRTRVALTFSGGSGKAEQVIVKIDANRRFKATKTTKLTGQLTVVALVKIAGKPSSQQARKRFKGPLAASAGGGGAAKGGGATAPVVPPGAKPLVGLFRLDPGKQTLGGALSGTYFRMLGIVNGDSTALDKNYTLLRPGTDGGLRTDVYQPPPSPAFAKTDPVSGSENGDALANRIVMPQKFFQIDFSIVTTPTDLQAGVPDPLPAIYAVDGKITGQVIAWTAAWNGLYFTQGSPKPDGSLGGKWGVGGTTPLTGTYDAATGHFQMSWQSLIQGGPFNGFSGQWFLEGTFVPAA